MSDHSQHDECLELLDAMEIGCTLSHYQTEAQESSDVTPA
ncbi:hypothetical protein CGU03_00290 [Vibrio metoecus]|uniref:Uncharacterized protein n=1 Tax=Vibrio metoecus TaxID=1481663 RepID=A0A271VZF7_VIBMT|nr:hypothetical protein CGU03_00290 [Vibrio metoecus]PAR24474.1 hypothetical protein CGU02_09510 [Vibrio metoecus]